MLDSNPDYKRYLRSNSVEFAKPEYRKTEMINNFIDEVKEKYKLRTSDKLSDLIDKIDMVSKFINVLR